MNDKNGVDRDPARTQPGNDAGKESAGGADDWETRALERVRQRVEQPEIEDDEPGWETDTITLLENYFKTRRI